MHDVFIAHVEEDADIALEIALGLEEVGYTTWCYEVDSIPGQSYLIQTGMAVEESKVVVVVISPHSLGSRQVTREVVRAHESGKEFIPVLRGITHVEFQNRQPEWREAIGAAASVSIPREGVIRVIPRIIDGLKSLRILPTSRTDAARIMQIRKTLDEVQGADMGEKAGELPIRAKEAAVKTVAAEKPYYISRWFWTGIALTSVGLVLQIFLVALSNPSSGYKYSWNIAFLVILTFAAPFIVSGAICLRKGMSGRALTKPAQGHVSNWWWLLPIMLAFVGGIISWARQKDVNWRKATNLLALGIILSVFWTIPFLVLQQSPVVPSALPEPPASAPTTPKAEQVAAPETPEVEPPALSTKPMYEDDFSNPASGWPTGSTETEEVIYADGEFCISVKIFDHSVWAYCTKPGVLADFTLEIDARLTSGPKDAGYGVVFRFQGDDNFYRFLVSEDGYYLVGARLNGKWTEFQGKTKSDFIKGGNSTNHLKVVCKGPQIEAYVNGHHLTTVIDNSFAEGYVGMIVDTALPNARVAFDNITVYSLK